MIIQQMQRWKIQRQLLSPLNVSLVDENNDDLMIDDDVDASDDFVDWLYCIGIFDDLT